MRITESLVTLMHRMSWKRCDHGHSVVIIMIQFIFIGFSMSFCLIFILFSCELPLYMYYGFPYIKASSESLWNAYHCYSYRWKRSSSGIVLDKGKRVLEFVAIQRKDNHQWAIPGV